MNRNRISEHGVPTASTDATGSPPNLPEVIPPAKRRRKAGPGRTPLLTARVQRVIIEAIATGNHYPVAAAYAGIDHDTLRLWRRRGERGQQPYADFVKALAQAEIEWEVAAVKAIHAAGEKDWRAHLELLSRRFPERWARTNREMNPVAVSTFEINIHLEDDADVHSAIPLRRTLPPSDDSQE